MKRAAVLILVLALAAPAFSQDPKPRREGPLFWIGAAALGGLGAADVALTIKGTRDYGLTEVNRLFRGSFESGRYWIPWTAQAIGTAAIVYELRQLIRNDNGWVRAAGWSMLVLGVAARAYVVIHNARLNHRMAHL